MIAWMMEIDRELQAKIFKHNPFESLVRKLTRITTIIPLSKCFLSQFYSLLNISKKWDTGHLSELAHSDLVFWKFLLHKAHDGFVLNLLSMRVPTHFYKADASSVGIGGYSLSLWPSLALENSATPLGPCINKSARIPCVYHWAMDQCDPMKSPPLFLLCL